MKKPSMILVEGFERYLADSNRRKRFCRPAPSHSAKVP